MLRSSKAEKIYILGQPKGELIPLILRALGCLKNTLQLLFAGKNDLNVLEYFLPNLD